MNTLASQFRKEKRVYLHNIISQEEASNLTQHMFDLHARGKTGKDDLCPLSESIYNDIKFNDLLKRLCEPLSTILELTLLPTYCYARIYKKGERLLPHLDRDQCEISGTMTLGFDPLQKVWPIYFGHVEESGKLTGTPVEIDVGDLAVYRGTELGHWRSPFQGTWQVQLFLHYVDANGPHGNTAMEESAVPPVSEYEDRL